MFLSSMVAWPVLAALDPVIAPPENPVTEAKRVLGKILFWDEQLSSDNTVACGTCHRPAAGGADPRRAVHPGPDQLFGTEDDTVGSPGIVRQVAGQVVSDPLFGLDAQVTGRASPSFIAAMYADTLFWDGRASSQFVDPQSPNQVLIASGGALESQAIGPILSSVEMAEEGRTWQDVIDKLEQVTPLQLASNIPADMQQALQVSTSYPALFSAAFGDAAVSGARIGMAIATYERTLVPDQAPWDLYMAGDIQAMTAAQINGWERIEQDTVCLNCHTPPLFSDNQFHNIGLRPSSDDPGLENTTGRPEDRGRFKTPSLRNVGLRPSLMHVGWVTDVMDSVDFYNANTDDVTSDHVQFTDDQTGIPTAGNNTVDYSTISFFSPNEAMQADAADFMANALTDPRVLAETFPFDRPTLSSERVEGVDEPSVIDIMSYNVNALDWSAQRADLIVETIDAQSPDVIGLQEAGITTFADLELRLNDDYEIYNFSDVSSTSNVILIKKNKFSVIDTGTSVEGDMQFCVRDRVITYLVLEELVSGSRFTFYNSQFCAQQTTIDNLPEGFSAEQVNESHAVTLANFIGANIEEFGDVAIAVGDLNASASSDTMAFLLEQASLPEAADNPIDLDSSWALSNSDPKSGVDWILLLADSVRTLGTQRIDNSTTQIASDHLPITATIELIADAQDSIVLTAGDIAEETLEIAAGTENVVMASFSLQGSDDLSELDSITLQAEGSGDDAQNIIAVKLYVDENNDGMVDGLDTLVASGIFANNDGQLQLTIPDSYSLPAGNTFFLLAYDF